MSQVFLLGICTIKLRSQINTTFDTHHQMLRIEFTAGYLTQVDGLLLVMAVAWGIRVNQMLKHLRILRV